MPSNALTSLDIAVVVAYFLVTIAVGLWVSRRIRTGRDFFLAGRSLPWWAIGFSLVATDIGGTDLIGGGGGAYQYGIAIANFEWIGCVPAMILAAFVFIPHFWKCGVTTIPEFLELRFSSSIRTVVAICWLAFMACNLGVMLLASAKMMHEMVGWDMTWTIWLVAILVGLYTFSGGLAAVVYTDVLQGVIMIAVGLSIAWIGVQEHGGFLELNRKLAIREAEVSSPGVNPDELSPRRTAEHLKLILPADSKSPFPWPGILFGLALIVSPAYWIGNQAIVQRSFGAQSDFDAKAAYVFGALLKTLIPFAIVIPGLVAFLTFRGIHDADLAIPRLVNETLPSGFRGLFLAAFLAALMSSVDSYVNSAAAIFTNDLYLRHWRPNADERRLLWVGRITTLVVMVWGVLFACAATDWNQGVYTLFQTMMSFLQGPLLAVLLLGMFTTGTTSTGALAGFVGGVTTSVGLYLAGNSYVCNALNWTPLFRVENSFLYYSIWSFLVAIAVSWVGSYAGGFDPPEKHAYVIGRR